jgi:hypothetical protein
MKNTYLLIIFILCESLTPAKALFSGIYFFDINQEITCSIDFYKNNTYELTFSYCPHGSDIVEVTTMSCGKFLITDKTINITDTIHGFKMQFCMLSNNKIKIERGFAFMKNKDLQYCGNIDKYQTRTVLYNITNQKRERQTYKQLHKTKYPLYYAIYESENNTVNDEKYGYFATGLGYELEFIKENKYRLLYKTILISEGTWKKDGNEIALFDSSLQHSFYVLISKEGLISKYLPGEYRSISLHKKRVVQSQVKKLTPNPIRACAFPVMEKRDPNEPLEHVEDMPKFPNGGDQAMSRFVEETLIIRNLLVKQA